MTREEAIQHARYVCELSKGCSVIALDANVIDALLSNPWHKASEELPKEEGTYLLRFWAGCSFEIFIGSYRNGKFGALTMEDGDYVTHWMPIPELPKEVNE